MKKFKKVLIATFSFLLLFGVSLGLASCEKDKKKEPVKKEVPTIKVYTRDTSSGTRDGFFTGIGKKELKESNDGLVKGYIEVEGNGDMITKIKNDEYGIGYISLSSLADSGLTGVKYEGIEPNEENVLAGTYKLTRNFNYMTRDEYADENVKKMVEAYIAYMFSKEGIKTITAKGGIVDKDITTKAKAWDEVKADHTIVDEADLELTVRLGGSTSVEKIAKALTEDFKALLKSDKINIEHDHTGSGDAFKRTNGESKNEAEKLDLGFASREFKDTEKAKTTGKICIDAIVVVVNKENTKLQDATAAQLVDIYTGKIKTWDLK